MSRRSAFKTRQRAKEGILGRRKIDSHILQTRTAKMAELVALSLRAHVKQEVCSELDRRGYPIRATDRSPCGAVPDDRHDSRGVHVEGVGSEGKG